MQFQTVVLAGDEFRLNGPALARLTGVLETTACRSLKQRHQVGVFKFASHHGPDLYITMNATGILIKLVKLTCQLV